jgi:hypothetical protein
MEALAIVASHLSDSRSFDYLIYCVNLFIYHTNSVEILKYSAGSEVVVRMKSDDGHDDMHMKIRAAGLGRLTWTSR